MTALHQHLQAKLEAAFAPIYLQLLNESDQHGTASDDSHYKLVLVSASFAGQRLLQRHRAVNKLLQEELAGPVHALALHLFSPDEWPLQQVPDSPACRGGSKLDN